MVTGQASHVKATCPGPSTGPSLAQPGARNYNSLESQKREKLGWEECLPSPPTPICTLLPPPSLPVAHPQFVTHLLPKFLALQDHTDPLSSTSRRTGPAHSSLGLWVCGPLGLEHSQTWLPSSCPSDLYPCPLFSEAFPSSLILNLTSPFPCPIFPYNIYFHRTSNILLGFF